MQKNSKNHENRKNSFFLETTSNTLIYVSNNISDVFDKFQVKISQKITWSIFTKISDPGYAKKIQSHQKLKNSLLLEATLNTLIYVSNNISDVFDKFQVKIFQKITWSIFAKISDTGSTKKFKNDKNWQIFFSLETT